MTGRSNLSPECLRYYKKLIAGLLITGGCFLLLEHLFTFDGFDIEFLGHEYYGIGMILTGFLLMVKREQIKHIVKAIRRKDIKGIIDEGERKK
ncbi:MAG: hypothetical protein DRO11_08335 [Methanobacteriota archaeon]|nr:MAG: hypothetical protein DRO11_08335 [Euryarchaeota archaeon]